MNEIENRIELGKSERSIRRANTLSARIKPEARALHRTAQHKPEARSTAQAWLLLHTGFALAKLQKGVRNQLRQNRQNRQDFQGVKKLPKNSCNE